MSTSSSSPVLKLCVHPVHPVLKAHPLLATGGMARPGACDTRGPSSLGPLTRFGHRDEGAKFRGLRGEARGAPDGVPAGVRAQGQRGVPWVSVGDRRRGHQALPLHGGHHGGVQRRVACLAIGPLAQEEGQAPPTPPPSHSTLGSKSALSLPAAAQSSSCTTPFSVIFFFFSCCARPFALSLTRVCGFALAATGSRTGSAVTVAAMGLGAALALCLLVAEVLVSLSRVAAVRPASRRGAGASRIAWLMNPLRSPRFAFLAFFFWTGLGPCTGSAFRERPAALGAMPLWEVFRHPDPAVPLQAVLAISRGPASMAGSSCCLLACLAEGGCWSVALSSKRLFTASAFREARRRLRGSGTYKITSSSLRMFDFLDLTREEDVTVEALFVGPGGPPPQRKDHRQTVAIKGYSARPNVSCCGPACVTKMKALKSGISERTEAGREKVTNKQPADNLKALMQELTWVSTEAFKPVEQVSPYLQPDLCRSAAVESSKTKFSRIKSFEVFLLGLAISNLEELIIVDFYEVIMLTYSIREAWLCQTLKFLNLTVEITSIFFTVLISVFRYQKLRDAEKRVNAPILLDSITAAWVASGICVALATALGMPIFFIKIDTHVASHNSSCPPDFFQCHEEFCPFLNRFYKYLFIVTCNLLPLLVVTVTSCLIIRVLMGQKRTVVPALGASRLPGKKSKRPKLQRSTVAILTAMGVFQVDWTLYLVFHLAFNPTDVPLWADIEFFITTSYTTVSPYVYGIGNNLFSFKSFMKK
ncbi:hypothetical protein CRUP_019730 [Coryphaenoides rupestris]|nr:hypothetical protein CRUP_019730 [Coryphaenoides rupestris]